jgi:large subunit ribosomal protein L5
VVNCGLGADAGNSKGLEAAMKDLAMITGQWPVKTKARKSVASFKIREGNTIGIAVTLRGRVSPIPLFIRPPQSSYTFSVDRQLGALVYQTRIWWQFGMMHSSI